MILAPVVEFELVKGPLANWPEAFGSETSLFSAQTLWACEVAEILPPSQFAQFSYQLRGAGLVLARTFEEGSAVERQLPLLDASPRLA